MQVIVSKEKFIEILTKSSSKRQIQAIGRALVHIYNRQTEDEKESKDTKYNNGIGFTGADAYSGAMTARFFLKHGTLADWQVNKWMKLNSKGEPRLAKYWKQINEEAVRKAASQTVNA